VSLAKSDSSTPLIADSVPSSLDHSSTTSGPGPCHRVCIWTRRHRTSCCSKPCAKPNHYMLYASIPITPNWSNTSGALSCRQRSSADTSNLPCYSSPATGSHVSSFTHSRQRRPGAVHSSEGWGFESLWPHFFFAGDFLPGNARIWIDFRVARTSTFLFALGIFHGAKRPSAHFNRHGENT
jgi:hypothetical protein